MTKTENYNRLKEFCLSRGAALFGVADISSLNEEPLLSNSIGENFNRRAEIPSLKTGDECAKIIPTSVGKLSQENFPTSYESESFRETSPPKAGRMFISAISLGARVSSSVLEQIDQFPTKLYFHHYRTLNVFLDQLALSVANFIQNLGFKSLPIPASVIVDWQKQTAHLSHKKIGYLAGLGWIGRNNLLVNRNLGSQFRLVTVLTNIPLQTDSPAKEDCGNCRACMVICPAKAIREKQEDFDHQGCFSLLKEFQRQKIVDQYICGICVKVCKGKNG